MRSTRTAAMLAAAALTMSGMSALVVNDGSDRVEARAASETAKPTPPANLSGIGERNAIARAMFGGQGRWKPARYPNGPGWTRAHVQRMARKRRNQKRNKRAHRG